MDLNQSDLIEAFSRKYTQGGFNSGFAEMLYFAQVDQCDYLVCSVLRVVSSHVTPTGDRGKDGLLLPVAYVPCLDGTTSNKPLKFLKAGSVSADQASYRWILVEHGAIINPAALKQVTHFNVLRTMAQGERAQGSLHIIVTAVPQTCASTKLEIHLGTDQTANLRGDQERESPAAHALKQKAQDRLAMIQENLLLRVIPEWSETAQVHTHMDNNWNVNLLSLKESSVSG